MAAAVEGVSVVIPALDEGVTLDRTVGEVQDALAGRDFEVIVVDDGSRDASAAGLERERGIRVVRNPVPMGYGNAVKLGVRSARHPLVATIDADGTYRARDLVLLLDALGGLEMAVGVRERRGLGPAPRRAARSFLARLAAYLAGAPIPDLNSGLRVFRRDLALGLESWLPSQFSYTSTITLAVLCSGRPVAWVPAAYFDREGSSKIQPLRDTFRFFGLLLRTACFFRPLKVFLPIGGALLLLAGLRLGYDVFVLHDIGDSAPLLLTSGLEVALMGLLAELVVRRR